MNNSTDVSTGVFAGALAVILVWILRVWVDVPAEVAAAFVVIFTGLIQYFVPPRNSMVNVPDDAYTPNNVAVVPPVDNGPVPTD